MRCGTARVFIQETLDLPLSPPDEALLEAHVAGCEACRAYRQAMARVSGAMAHLAIEPAPRDFAAGIQFRIRRERSPLRWAAPAAAAAVVLIGFAIVRPTLTGTPLRVASQTEGAEHLAAKVAPAVPGKSILDAIPSGPEARQPAAAEKLEADGAPGMGLEAAAPGAGVLEEAPAARPAAAPAPVAPAKPAGLFAGLLRRDAAPGGSAERDEARRYEPMTVAAAPRTVTSLEARSARTDAEAPAAESFLEEAAPAREVAKSAEAKAGRGAVAKQAPGQPAPERSEGRPKDEAADRALASLPAPRSMALGERAGAGAAFAPGAMSAYRASDSRHARARRRPLTPAEQAAVDQATFEILQWLDPAADGGPMLELQEVDFTLP